MSVYRVRERARAGIECADLGWLMPVWAYDRDMWPYSRGKGHAEVFTNREEAQKRADQHGGEVIEEDK